jgi:hypothetical protein
VRRGERGQVRRQVLGERRGVGLDAHHPLQAARIVGDLGAHLVDAGEHLARAEQQGLARGRELDAARAAVEQLHAELVLELRDAAAGRGERDVGKVRRLGDALRLRDPDEEGEGAEVGPHGAHYADAAELTRPAASNRNPHPRTAP